MTIKNRLQKLEIMAGVNVPEFIIVNTRQDMDKGRVYEVPGKDPMDQGEFKEWEQDRGKNEIVILITWQ